MKNYTILLLGICILMSACRKENSTLEGEINDTETTEISSVLFEGQILDGIGDGLEATLDIYQNENKIGSIQTDSNGNYITENLFIEPDVEITFDIYRSGYKNKYRRLTKGKGIHTDQDFTLVSNEDAFGGPSGFIDNPGSSDYIVISKTILDVNGEPVPNIFCSVSYDHELTANNTILAKGGLDITNADGYMEVLLPKGNELFHFTAQFIDDTNIECNNSYHFGDTTFFNSILEKESLGVINEDYEITEYPDVAIYPTEYTVSGNLLNCDGTPVTSGDVTLRVTYAFGTFPNAMQFSTNDFDVDGNYSLKFEICNYGEYSAELVGVGDDGGIVELEFTGNLGTSEVPSLSTCGETIVDDSYLDLQIGNVKTLEGIQFTQSIVTETSILALGFHPDHGNLQFNVENVELGDNHIDLLNLNFPNPKPYSFNSQNGELVLSVTSTENGYITGIISGSTETTELGVQEITGDLYIKYQ